MTDTQRYFQSPRLQITEKNCLKKFVKICLPDSLNICRCWSQRADVFLDQYWSKFVKRHGFGVTYIRQLLLCLQVLDKNLYDVFCSQLLLIAFILKYLFLIVENVKFTGHTESDILLGNFGENLFSFSVPYNPENSRSCVIHLQQAAVRQL